jgi:hypothetical protein
MGASGVATNWVTSWRLAPVTTLEPRRGASRQREQRRSRRRDQWKRSDTLEKPSATRESHTSTFRLSYRSAEQADLSMGWVR